MNLNEKYVIAKLAEWKQSPLLFVKECLQASPTTQQAEALMSFAGAKRTSIRSGHGCGKSTTASWLILWFAITRPFARIACTAPTARQLSDILWSELAKWTRKSILAEEFVIQKDKIFQKDYPKEWWIRAISPSVKAGKDEQAETLAGLHADHLLIVVDEASGVPDPVYIPLEGAITGEDNKVLLIGNPTKNKGYFNDTHFDVKISKSWNKLHWNSEKSEIVSKETVQYFRDKYGYDSNVYRIRILGEPPLDDENTLIPLSWSLQCIDNEVIVADDEPTYLGVDVARYGEDKSIILPRQGLKILPWNTFQSMNTIELGMRVNQVYFDMEADGIAIDEIGVGAGVTDWLVKHGKTRTFGVNVGNSSSDIGKYARLRDELWWRVREKCMKGVYSFPDGEMGQTLCDELSSPRYEYTINGGVKVEGKKEMKMRGVASPNIADALCLTEYFAAFASKVWKNGSSEKKKVKVSRPWDKVLKQGVSDSESWMVR